MYDQCIKCELIGKNCVPNLFELSWPDLLNWWKERQKFLGWSNQVLSDKSGVPLGTITRIKSGEDDCKYSTMRMILHALLGGYSAEFPCQKKLDAEFAHIAELECQCSEQAARMKELTVRLSTIDELHRRDVAAIIEGSKKDIAWLREMNDFLREQLTWQREHAKNA